MMKVPGNDNGSSPQSAEGPPAPDDTYLMLAAATMHAQGRLTKQQQPGFVKPGPGERGAEYSDVTITPEGYKQLGEATGGIRIGDTSKQRRSEETEDIRDESMTAQARRAGDLSMARQKKQPFSQPTAGDIARTRGQPDLSTTQMAKQLGINDVDAFMDFLENQRAKEANMGRDKLKAAMKAR